MKRLLPLLCCLTMVATVKADTGQAWRWDDLPPLPRALAGQAAGTSGGKLLVMGGTYWSRAPWDAGQKIWIDTVYALDAGGHEWREVGRLPQPLAYSAVVTTTDGSIIIGGQTATDVSAQVYRVRLDGDRLDTTRLPDLPQPMTNSGAALLGNIVYVAGGQATPTATTALGNFYALDLSAPAAGWRLLELVPGANRILPVVAAQDGAVYVVSGAELLARQDGSPTRRFLTDGYRFRPDAGWTRIADAPRAAVAAPAFTQGPSHIFVLVGSALLTLVLIVGGVEGGAGALIATALADGKLRAFDLSADYTTTTLWVVLLGNLFSQLVPYTTDQSVIQRYLTTPSEREARQAIWLNALFVLPATIIFFSIGTALYVFYKQHPESLNTTMQADAIFPWFIVGEMPVGVSGLVIAGLFAAGQSGTQNSIATALVTDFYRRFRTNPDEDFCLRLARGLTLALGFVGVGCAALMATFPIKSLWDVFLTLLGLLGGSLAGAFALGIFTRRAHTGGVMIGVVTSIATLAIVQNYTRVHFLVAGRNKHIDSSDRALPGFPRDEGGAEMGGHRLRYVPPAPALAKRN